MSTHVSLHDYLRSTATSACAEEVLADGAHSSAIGVPGTASLIMAGRLARASDIYNARGFFDERDISATELYLLRDLLFEASQMMRAHATSGRAS